MTLNNVQEETILVIVIQPYMVRLYSFIVLFGFMVFNATLNNISVISWQSVLLVEETRVPRENHRSVVSH